MEKKMFIIYHCIPMFIGISPTGKERKEYAGFVMATDLQDAFVQSNHIEGSEWDEDRRSTSIGDVIQGDDGFFLVTGDGFRELTSDLSLERAIS
jgi:hypothetical protein